MPSFSHDPTDDMPDADWIDQHEDLEDAGDDPVTSIGDVDADPADRIDQTLDVPEDEDAYDRG